MICVIFNHNHNENSANLLEMFSRDMDTVVLDSGSSVEDPRFSIMGNIYYSNLLNESARLMNLMNKSWLLFITGDIEIDKENYTKLITATKNLDGIGSYSPSVSKISKSHGFCKRVSDSGLRDVNFNEGFMSIVSSDIINKICPVNSNINKHGWGLDVYTGYQCKKSGLRCVVDDSVEVYHPHSTGYDLSEASYGMYSWADNLNDPDFKQFLYTAI